MEPELEKIAKSNSPLELVPEYSLDDIERFVRETNLCPTCRIIFGPQEAWIQAGQYWDKDYFKHHPSAQSLLQSVEAGCSLCIQLRVKLVRGSSHRELEDEGDAALQRFGPLVFELRRSLQFLCFWTTDTEPGNTTIVVRLPLVNRKTTLFYIL